MKFVLIIVILATSLPNSQAWMQKKLFRKEADVDTTTVDDEQVPEQADEDQEICTKRSKLNRELRDCINVGWPDDDPNSDFVLNGLVTMCENKTSIRQCMIDKIAGCETNYDTIVGLVDTSLSFCVGNEIPGDIRNFLETNNVTVNESCAEAVSDFDNMTSQRCNRNTMPACTSSRKLTERIEATDSFFWWLVNCFMTSNLTEVADFTCGNVTRGQAYGLGISSLPLFYGLGINHYAKFEAFKQAYNGLGFF